MRAPKSADRRADGEDFDFDATFGDDYLYSFLTGSEMRNSKSEVETITRVLNLKKGKQGADRPHPSQRETSPL